MKINHENEKLIDGILQFLGTRAEVFIILSRCCACHDLLSAKLGHGVAGISDTYCGHCAKILQDKIKNDHGNSAIWPMIGCLLAGGLLAWEYVYAILKYLG
jgi:hypothetical protein